MKVSNNMNGDKIKLCVILFSDGRTDGRSAPHVSKTAHSPYTLLFHISISLPYNVRARKCAQI